MAEITTDQCRTCLTKESKLISLVADHVVCDKVMSVLELIKTCTSAQIELDDDYPQYVCLQCIHSAEKSYEFRIQCEKADNSLRSNVKAFDDDDDDSCENYEVLDPEVKTEDENYLTILENNIKTEEVDNYSCNICDLNFPTATALTKHTSFSHPPNFYQCPNCPVRFISRDLLDKHVVKHNNDKQRKNKRKRKVDYVCGICGKKYANITVLNNHVRKHTTDEKSKKNNANTYICHSCDHHFVSAEDLQLHMEKIHALKSEEKETTTIPTKFKCKYCYKIFTEEDELQEHLRVHSKKKRNTSSNKVSYKCKICNLSTRSLEEMKDHLETHDINAKDIFSHLFYQCVECEQVFDTIYEFFNHSSTVHVGTKIEHGSSAGTRVVRKRPYTCDVQNCNKSFPSPSALKKHSLSHESQWPKKCRYCDAVMSKWHEYMMHLNDNHDDKKTFVCSQCGKKFFRERNLQSHMKTHNGERNYMCDFCGFSFLAQNNLVAHRRIHTGVKPYKCTYCPQAFAQHAGLRSHLLNHNGEKKHECPTCSKKFLRIGALRNHIKTHTGVKDYACHICGARFGASSTRKKHLLTHTGERNHICDYCGKAFSRRSNLSVHRKIHTGETPHVCEVCGKGFIQAHVLRSHMNTHRKRGELKKDKTEKIPAVQNDTPEDITVLIEFD